MSMASSSPLLHKCGGEEEDTGGDAWWRRLLNAEEAKQQLSFAFPMILTNVAYYAITLVSVMFAGHLGDVELAGATLGNSWGAVCGIDVMIGLSGALETLCGQAYGAKQYRMLGVYLQSSLIISTFFCILISILWYFTDSILIWLHQDPQVSKMAGLYFKYLIPGLFAYASLQCLLRFLQTQTVVAPLVVCSMVPLLIHGGLAYVTVHVLGLGFKGTSLSASVSLWISFLMLAVYVKYSDKFRYTWEGFTAEAFRKVVPAMKLAAPSAVMVCFEYWAFEILVLLAGLQPNSAPSTCLIAMCVNTETIAYMVTYGFSAAVSTRVSNEIGAGNIDNAKNAVAVAMKLAVLLGLAIVLLLGFGHDLWAKLFSDSREIVSAFAGMTGLLTVSIVLDSAQGVLSGVSRGCGWQHLAAWTNLVAFYVIGMPLAILFSFKLGFHAQGLWMGLIFGLCCQSVALMLITLRTNWRRMKISDDHGGKEALV